MAKLVSDAIVIEISRVARDGEELAPIVSPEMNGTLEAVVQELVGDGAVVEVKTGS